MDSHSRTTRKRSSWFSASNHDFQVVVLDNPRRHCHGLEHRTERQGRRTCLVTRIRRFERFCAKNVETLENGENIVGGHRSVIDDDSPGSGRFIAETSVFGSGMQR